MKPNLNPQADMEMFALIHESHHRPPDHEFEYMTGKLRQQLEDQEFGPVLTKAGKERLATVADALAHLEISKIITQDFVVTRETAVLLEKKLFPESSTRIHLDSRVCESDLSYLDRERFNSLGELERAGDPNATLRDWMKTCPNDFQRVVSNHVSLWNEICDGAAESGSVVAILHVEGVLLFLVWALGLPSDQIHRIHAPRGVPIHIRLHPKDSPVVSLGDSATWGQIPAHPFGHYG